LVQRFGSDPHGRTLIFSASRDKRIGAMLGRLLPNFDRVILTKITSNPRGCELAVLQRTAVRVGRELAEGGGSPPRIEVAGDVQTAWSLAHTTDRPLSCLATTGSAFLIGEILPVIRNQLAPDPPKGVAF
jgi:folylpolyglutamate synthase/dihydropteroate synthase